MDGSTGGGAGVNDAHHALLALCMGAGDGGGGGVCAGASIAVQESPLGGLGVFASRALPRGADVLCCPEHCLLTASGALSHPTIGPPLKTLRSEAEYRGQLDDRALTMLLLLHHRRCGAY